MKTLIIIIGIVGLTLIALYVVASLKGLTLEQYLNSIWGRYRGGPKLGREAEAEELRTGEIVERDMLLRMLVGREPGAEELGIREILERIMLLRTEDLKP